MKNQFYYKKRLLAVFITTILIGLTINSCKKEKHLFDTDDTITNPQILQAKSWYESAYPVNTTTDNLAKMSAATSSSFDYSQYAKPDWSGATSYIRLNRQTVEIPLINSINNLITKLNNNSTSNTFNNSYSKSSYILLKTGSGYSAYIMTIIADSSYIAGDPSKLNKNSYRKRDINLSGKVLYFTLKANLLKVIFIKTVLFTNNFFHLHPIQIIKLKT